MATFQEAIAAGKTTTENALAIFDSLPTVKLEELHGKYEGSSFPTGHLQDGFLEASGWYGKTFDEINQVHPLVFRDGNDLFAVNPIATLTQLEPGKNAKDSRDKLETKEHAARLRMVEYRGVSTASMIYNQAPIIDHFRKVDDQTLLGAMDNIQMPGPPFFFVLRRRSQVGL
ncbi:hypothetical protein BS50DRAFT_569405 [Corynespora cassiicola Philippines]|uniref:Uncharacterized protein n=1 Tax=Corynespora cassiicola Philippines TaxID=1448308 RepID=A0A2T2P378_CORCC|nr:hypothetical protein BS50DRAFT_569405 [Corynespora cassiicola Philippines]